jgi:protoheme IX farnesyltransferase
LVDTASFRAVERVRDYVDLTKPRLLPLVLITGLPVMGMASGGWPPLSLALPSLVGIALAAASANTLNAYLEREVDKRMERTRARPLPSGKLAPQSALIFGWLLGIGSTLLLWVVAGLMTAAVAVASILYYVFVYTIWLKPRSAWNAVVGGAAGAAAPLIADVAVNGHLGMPGLLLFAIVFFWQPPHVWAIALYRKADYEAAGIPMLPNVIGDEGTRRWILICTFGLVPVTLAPGLLGLLGSVYMTVAVGVNAWFVISSIQLAKQRTDEAARRMFHVSLAYLFAICFAMLIDLAI